VGRARGASQGRARSCLPAAGSPLACAAGSPGPFALSSFCLPERLMDPPLDILHEDNHCLAVSKPAGVASAHFQGDAETLDRLVKRYLKAKYGKPGNVFLGIVHRLDKPVSGVLLFARTSKAAARLCEQFREGAIDKVYWAVVEGEVTKDA